jgi:hypothetical protein
LIQLRKGPDQRSGLTVFAAQMRHLFELIGYRVPLAFRSAWRFRSDKRSVRHPL